MSSPCFSSLQGHSLDGFHEPIKGCGMNVSVKERASYRLLPSASLSAVESEGHSSIQELHDTYCVMSFTRRPPEYLPRSLPKTTVSQKGSPPQKGTWR